MKNWIWTVLLAPGLALAADPNDAKMTGWTSQSTGYALVDVAPGTFTMGSPESEAGRFSEPEHAVTISHGFQLGATEVTQGQYQSVMGSNPSETAHYGLSLLGDRLPVQNVSWCDAVLFANALSARDGLRPVYGGADTCAFNGGATVTWDPAADGYRLPTEAEWEYAARAGTQGRYPNAATDASICAEGNVADQSNRRRRLPGWEDQPVFTCDDKSAGPTAVASYRANPWGIYDLTGNVWEWTWDRFADYSGPGTDPVGPTSGSERIHRGSGWIAGPPGARVAFRMHTQANTADWVLGFRLARSVSGAPTASAAPPKPRPVEPEEHFCRNLWALITDYSSDFAHTRAEEVPKSERGPMVTGLDWFGNRYYVLADVPGFESQSLWVSSGAPGSLTLKEQPTLYTATVQRDVPIEGALATFEATRAKIQQCNGSILSPNFPIALLGGAPATGPDTPSAVWLVRGGEGSYTPENFKLILGLDLADVRGGVTWYRVMLRMGPL